MKKLTTITFALIFCFLMPGSGGAISLGVPAPDFTLSDTNGKAVALSSYRGKPVVLNFWSTTCPPCLAEMPSLESLHKQMGKKGLVVLGVAVEKDVASVKEIMAAKKITFAVLLDPEKEVYFDNYGLFGLPITLIINKQGIVVDRVIGETAWDSPAMKEKLGKLL